MIKPIIQMILLTELSHTPLKFTLKSKPGEAPRYERETPDGVRRVVIYDFDVESDAIVPVEYSSALVPHSFKGGKR